MTCNWEDRFPTYWNIMNQFGSFFNTYPPLKHEVRSWKMLEFRVLVDVSSCGASKLMSFLGMVGIPFSAGRNHWVVGYVSVVKHWPRWPEASQMCKSTYWPIRSYPWQTIKGIYLNDFFLFKTPWTITCHPWWIHVETWIVLVYRIVLGISHAAISFRRSENTQNMVIWNGFLQWINCRVRSGRGCFRLLNESQLTKTKSTRNS